MKQGMIWLFVAMLVVADPSMAMAAENRHPEADKLFRKGREEWNKGHTKEALDFFKQSEVLAHSSLTQLDIAACEARLGRVFSALQMYRALLASNAPDWKHATLIKRNIAKLTPRVAKLHLRLSAIEPKGMVIKIDGKEIASRDLKGDIEIDPGLHPLVAWAPNHQEVRHIVAVHAGQTQNSPLIQLQRIRSKPEREITKNSPVKTNWPGTVLGVGGVMIGFGAIMVGTGLLARREGEETYHAGAMPATGMRTNTQLATYGAQTAQIGGREFYTGLAFGGVGLALVIVGGRWLGSSERGARKLPLRPTVQVSKTVLEVSLSRAF